MNNEVASILKDVTAAIRKVTAEIGSAINQGKKSPQEVFFDEFLESQGDIGFTAHILSRAIWNNEHGLDNEELLAWINQNYDFVLNDFYQINAVKKNKGE